MATQWVHRLIFIVPVADQGEANSLLTTIWPGEEAEAQTLTVSLSADGLDPATYYGADGSLTDGLWIAARELLESAPVTWQWYRLDYLDHILVERSAATDSLNEPFNFSDALVENGLQTIEPEFP